MNHTSFAIIPRLFISFDASAAFFVRSERKTFNVSQRPTRRYIAILHRLIALLSHSRWRYARRFVLIIS